MPDRAKTLADVFMAEAAQRIAKDLDEHFADLYKGLAQCGISAQDAAVSLQKFGAALAAPPAGLQAGAVVHIGGETFEVKDVVIGYEPEPVALDLPEQGAPFELTGVWDDRNDVVVRYGATVRVKPPACYLRTVDGDPLPVPEHNAQRLILLDD